MEIAADLLLVLGLVLSVLVLWYIPLLRRKRLLLLLKGCGRHLLHA